MPGDGGRAVRGDVLHLRPVGGPVGDRAGVHPEVGVPHHAGADQLLGDRPGGVDRDREAEADRAALVPRRGADAADGGVDADHGAGGVDQRDRRSCRG